MKNTEENRKKWRVSKQLSTLVVKLFARRNKNRAWKVARRIALLIPLCNLFYFWTFTFFLEVDNKEKGEYWNKFIAALRYYYPDLKFFKVIECHKSGQWHFHVLFNCFVDWHIAQRLWEQCKAGKVVFVKPVKDRAGVAYYIAKYITKSLEGGAHHIYSSSPDFCIHSSNFVKWIWRLIDFKLLAEVENIFSYFDFKEYTKICGDAKKRAIQVLVQYRKWGYSW